MSADKQEINDNLLHILIAVDKFKGSLTSAEAALAIKTGMEIRLKNHPHALSFDIVEMADGGDGSAAIVKKYCSKSHDSFREITCTATNPIGKQINLTYIIYDKTAFIEMASVSGLELLSKQERNPLYTTTYGLGEVIRHAAGEGVEEIILSIGGSATNDGGTGMLQPLGFKFMNSSGHQVTAGYMCGKELEHISEIIDPDNDLLRSHGISLKVICDVTNPLLGKNGATMVYAAQKGANSKMQEQLESGMVNYAAVAAARDEGADRDKRRSIPKEKISQSPGSGAAGGVGFAAMQFLGAELISGWKFFAELTNLEQRIAQAHLVISGEGKIDSQSMQGKVIDGVLQLAAAHSRPVVLFCGVNATEKENAKLSAIKIYALADIEPNLEKCMQNAFAHLTELATLVAHPVIGGDSKLPDGLPV